MVKTPCISGLLLLLIGALTLQAAQYILPDTLWAHVTYYDFHADGTNPNFGTYSCGTARGMVQDTLDNNRKPILAANVCYNDRIDEWFRPSNAPGAVFDPRTGHYSGLTNYLGRPNEWVGSAYNASNPMADVVLYDSLPFVLQDSATGTYTFIQTNQTGGNFHPLQGKGFGADDPGSTYNKALSMEIHSDFEYQGGEFFSFRGVDDLWIFVNGKLALDLGGMNANTRRNLDLDALAASLGIVKGGTYDLDIFYTERGGNDQANIEITTNLLTPSEPAQIIVKTNPNPLTPGILPRSITDSLIRAGDTLKLWAFTMDDTLGTHPEWDTTITWQIIDTAGNTIPNATFKGDSTVLFPTEAYGTIRVVLSFQHPDYPGVELHDTLFLRVGPGRADHILIEANADSLSSPRNDNPLQAVVFTSATATRTVYAVLRDAYGNFISASPNNAWSSDTARVATVIGSSGGQGLVAAQAQGQTNVIVYNSQANLVKPRDSIPVTVDLFFSDTLYDSMRICVNGAAGITMIALINMYAGHDTTLTAQARRKTDGIWVAVRANWSATVNLATSTAPPSAQAIWLFDPKSAGSAVISVSYASRYNASISMTVTTAQPQPAIARIYDSNGNGIPDNIIVSFTGPSILMTAFPSVADMVQSLSLVNASGTTVSLTPYSVNRINDTSFSIVLQEGRDILTFWQSATITITQIAVTTDNKYIAIGQTIDMVGPVIKTARYYPASAIGGVDTIEAILSEPVNIEDRATPVDVFNFFRMNTLYNQALNGLNASDIINPSSDGMTFKIILRNGFPVLGSDSLQLATSSVQDKINANYAPSNGRKAAIVWTAVINLQATAGPNPFRANDIISAPVRQFYANVVTPVTGSVSQPLSGTIVGITTDKPLKIEADGSSGSAYVLDALGNTVVKNLPVRQAQNYRDYGVYWDGRNSNGRTVGAGTYLLILSVKDIDDNNFSKRIKIGVRG